MAQDNTVSFKAYLLQGNTNNKSEVRRFGIDRDVVSSFDYLKEKLQHVFPTLRNQNFSLVWKDADNDDVVISSDDELMIALAEMQNEVRKLYIKVLGASAHSPNAEATGQAYEDPRHKGVICDVCDQQIEGFRYHCTECFDYDLCSNCEAKKMHREHIMIRLPAPVSSRVLNSNLGQVMAHLDALKGHHGHGHGRDRRHHHGREKWCRLDRTLGEMLAMNPDEMVCSADEYKQSCSAEKGKQNVSAEEIRGKMKTKHEKFAKARGKKAEYMWSVGQKIAEFLDPWGIDVDVRVLTRDENENKNEEEKKGEEKMETEETQEDEVQNKDPKCSAGEGSNEAGPSQAPEACVANTTAQTERASPETDDWTVLNAVPADRQQENHNPPEPTAAATSANQVQNETEEPTPSTAAAAPIQVEAISVNQVQSGAGEPLTSRTSAHMFPGVGTPGMPSSGASAPYIGMPAGANGPIYGGLRTPGMPASGTNVPMYAGLRTTGMPASGTNAPIHAGAGAAGPSATGSYYTNIYPAIPNTNIPQFYIQAPNHPVQPRQGYSTYTRPHVADAVQKMMAMGFSNEGGWLTQLLEIKNGDIEKALDVLQPVKRS